MDIVLALGPAPRAERWDLDPDLTPDLDPDLDPVELHAWRLLRIFGLNKSRGKGKL